MNDYLSRATPVKCTPCIGECSTCPTSQARLEVFLSKYFPRVRHSSSVREDTRFEADTAGHLASNDMRGPVSRYDMFGD